MISGKVYITLVIPIFGVDIEQVEGEGYAIIQELKDKYGSDVTDNTIDIDQGVE